MNEQVLSEIDITEMVMMSMSGAVLSRFVCSYKLPIDFGFTKSTFLSIDLN